MLLERELNLVV